MKQRKNEEIIIVGDLNAHHHSWSLNNTKTNSHRIVQLLEEARLVIINKPVNQLT